MLFLLSKKRHQYRFSEQHTLYLFSGALKGEGSLGGLGGLSPYLGSKKKMAIFVHDKKLEMQREFKI